MKALKQIQIFVCGFVVTVLLFAGLCFSCASALASEQTAAYTDIDEIYGEAFWDQFNLQSLSDISSISFTVSGDHAYQLMANGDLYQLDMQSMEYSLLCRVPALPTSDFSAEMRYSDLDEYVKMQADSAVFQIIGDIREDRLYGYCPVSGRIGIIDETGIHWKEAQFDSKDTNRMNIAYPEALLCAFVDGNLLYAFVDRAADSDAPCQGSLVSFDLDSGKCSYVDLPGVYAFCPYMDGVLLMLTRNSQGRLCLDSYTLSNGNVASVVSSLPIELDPGCGEDWFSVASLVSGLAYDQTNNVIFLAGENGLWHGAAESLSYESFDDKAWDTRDPYGQAWISENGNYIFRNGTIVSIR